MTMTVTNIMTMTMTNIMTMTMTIRFLNLNHTGEIISNTKLDDKSD